MKNEKNCTNQIKKQLEKENKNSWKAWINMMLNIFGLMWVLMDECWYFSADSLIEAIWVLELRMISD